MPPPDPFERLTLLERAQLLHDSTLRRHGDMLDRHETEMALLREIQASQTQTLLRLTDIAARLETTLAAIKDLLPRGNGH